MQQRLSLQVLCVGISLLAGCGSYQAVEIYPGSIPTLGSSLPAEASFALSDAAVAGVPSPIVKVEQGQVQGAKTSLGHSFLGIPYAEPPVGLRRLRAPEKKAAWAGVRQARSYGAKCPQALPPWSEDCLYLNVWSADLTKPKPVMFFSHPAAGVMGSGGKFAPGIEFDSALLTSRYDVVVVTYNYRLGALGYLVHEALDSTAANGKSGNYGFQDQVMALAWVKKNIAAFGGDPNNITVFGHSSGSNSTCNLASSPKSRDLMARTLTMSMVCGALPREHALELGDQVVDDICGKATNTKLCLLLAPPDAFVRAQITKQAIIPSVDGTWITASDNSVFDGKAPSSFFIGSNTEEIPFAVLSGLFPNETAFDKIIAALFVGADLKRLKADFKPTAAVSWAFAGAEAMVYGIWTCNVDRLAKDLVARGHQVRQYSFHAAAKYHGAELLPLFQHLTDDGNSYLEKLMGTLWTDFAKGKAPKFDGVDAPLYGNGTLYIQDDKISVTNLKAETKCVGFNGATFGLHAANPEEVLAAARAATR